MEVLCLLPNDPAFAYLSDIADDLNMGTRAVRDCIKIIQGEYGILINVTTSQGYIAGIDGGSQDRARRVAEAYWQAVYEPGT